MKCESMFLTTDDNVRLYTVKWLPDEGSEIRAVVQIAHGIAEHISRYKAFAEALTQHGFAVYGNDHRGHGKTGEAAGSLGYFADKDGWSKVVDDMHLVTSNIKKEQPGLPVYLFGHSMGSFLSRTYISKYGDELAGVVLSGTSGSKGLLGMISPLIAKWEAKRRGWKATSPLINNLAFGSNNKCIEPLRTSFDWLSRDAAEVDKYIADPLCGFDSSIRLINDMASGINEYYKRRSLKKVPKTIPMLLVSGEKDPVGNYTKGVMNAVDTYKKAGLTEVTYKFYQDARHELLNEINREEVYNDVIKWLEAHS